MVSFLASSVQFRKTFVGFRPLNPTYKLGQSAVDNLERIREVKAEDWALPIHVETSPCRCKGAENVYS